VSAAAEHLSADDLSSPPSELDPSARTTNLIYYNEVDKAITCGVEETGLIRDPRSRGRRPLRYDAVGKTAIKCSGGRQSGQLRANRHHESLDIYGRVVARRTYGRKDVISTGHMRRRRTAVRGRRHTKRRLIRHGVHTPEFSFEHELAGVRRDEGARDRLPGAVDNDYYVWNALTTTTAGLYFVERMAVIRDSIRRRTVRGVGTPSHPGADRQSRAETRPFFQISSW